MILREKARIYNRQDKETIQVIRCEPKSKLVKTTGFAGGGMVSNAQTLDLITRDKLKDSVEPSKVMIEYRDKDYAIMQIQEHSTHAIKGRVKERKTTIISLQ